jgi:hypothetical protein
LHAASRESRAGGINSCETSRRDIPHNEHTTQCSACSEPRPDVRPPAIARQRNQSHGRNSNPVNMIGPRLRAMPFRSWKWVSMSALHKLPLPGLPPSSCELLEKEPSSNQLRRQLLVPAQGSTSAPLPALRVAASGIRRSIRRSRSFSLLARHVRTRASRRTCAGTRTLPPAPTTGTAAPPRAGVPRPLHRLGVTARPVIDRGRQRSGIDRCRKPVMGSKK